MKHFCLLVLTLLLAAPLTTHAQTAGREWTLQDCIDYALQNNIQLKKNRITRLSAEEDVLQSRADLLPSLSASTNQNVVYRPFVSSGQSTVANGYVQSSIDKVYYNGSYGINANWTVWNGNRNRNTIKLNQLSAQQAEIDSVTMARTIEEQIVKLYVQILYSTEAIEVNRQSLATSRKNEERGQAMVEVGKMSKADLAQLTAQRAQDEYNIVAAENNVKNYTFQLRQVLELTEADAFEIAVPTYTDAQALEEIPALSAVYARALESRPEIQSARLAIEGSEVSIDIAKAAKLPTVGVNGTVATNTTSMDNRSWGSQLKTNFDMGVGATVSIPLFDNRQAKTALNKARLQREKSLLDLREQEKNLYNTIEGYWIEGMTNQSNFKAAREATKSQEASYELLSEQFRLGLKNIVELMTGKTNLVNAQQNELQSKYLTILDIYLLKLYQR